MAMLISPSAVWIGFDRVPLREPVAVCIRSYRARPRRQQLLPPQLAATPGALPADPARPGARAILTQPAGQQLGDLLLQPGARGDPRYPLHRRSSPVGGFLDLPWEATPPHFYSNARTRSRRGMRSRCSPALSLPGPTLP